MIKFFSVIPAKAGIQWFLKLSWIPGLRSAAPGMTVIEKYRGKKLDHRVTVKMGRDIIDFVDFVEKMDFRTVSKPYPFSDFHDWG